MTTETKRDLHADLAVCDAATPGLWEADLNSDDSAQILSTSAPGWVCQTWYKNEEVMPNSANNARFIAEARQGWPEAIRRAIAAEAENERLRKALVSTARRLHFIETWRYDERLEVYHYTREEHEMLIDTAREALRK